MRLESIYFFAPAAATTSLVQADILSAAGGRPLAGILAGGDFLYWAQSNARNLCALPRIRPKNHSSRHTLFPCLRIVFPAAGNGQLQKNQLLVLT